MFQSTTLQGQASLSQELRARTYRGGRSLRPFSVLINWTLQ